MALLAASSGTINFNYGTVSFMNGLSTYCVALRNFNRGSGYGTRTDIFRQDGTLNIQERQSPDPMSVCGAVWRTAQTLLQDVVIDLVAGWNTIIFNQTSTTSITIRVNGSSQTFTTGSSGLATGINPLYYLGKGDASTECCYSAGIAEVCVWNAPLTTGEIIAFEAGFAPRLIRPQAILFCDRSIAGGQDIKGQLLPAATTGVSAFSHPRTFG